MFHMLQRDLDSLTARAGPRLAHHAPSSTSRSTHVADAEFVRKDLIVSHAASQNLLGGGAILNLARVAESVQAPFIGVGHF